MSDEMTLERFEELVAAYGAQVDNWPQEARTDMQHISGKTMRCADAILARAAGLMKRWTICLPDHMADGDAHFARYGNICRKAILSPFPQSPCRGAPTHGRSPQLLQRVSSAAFLLPPL